MPKLCVFLRALMRGPALAAGGWRGPSERRYCEGTWKQAAKRTQGFPCDGFAPRSRLFFMLDFSRFSLSNMVECGSACARWGIVPAAWRRWPDGSSRDSTTGFAFPRPVNRLAPGSPVQDPRVPAPARRVADDRTRADGARLARPGDPMLDAAGYDRPAARMADAVAIEGAPGDPPAQRRGDDAVADDHPTGPAARPGGRLDAAPIANVAGGLGAADVQCVPRPGGGRQSRHPGPGGVRHPHGVRSVLGFGGMLPGRDRGPSSERTRLYAKPCCRD